MNEDFRNKSRAFNIIEIITLSQLSSDFMLDYN